MHKTMLKQGNTALIAGLLVVLAAAGLFRLLWLYIHAPIFWVVVAAWLVLPLVPFAIRMFSMYLSPRKREADGIC